MQTTLYTPATDFTETVTKPGKAVTKY